MYKVGFVVYPTFSPMTFAATSVFEAANWRLGSAAYEVAMISERGGPVTTSLGYKIQTSAFKRRSFDTIVVAGMIGTPEVTPGLIRYLRSAAPRTRLAGAARARGRPRRAARRAAADQQS